MIQIEKKPFSLKRNDIILFKEIELYIVCFSGQSLMFKPHVAFKSISATQSVFVLFPTFSNAHRLEKGFNRFDTVQSTWPSSWILKRVLRNTFYLTVHV